MSQLKGVLPALSSLSPEPITETGNLLQDEALLQQGILLLVKALMQIADAGPQLIPAWHLSWQLSPPGTTETHQSRLPLRSGVATQCCTLGSGKAPSAMS